MSQQPISLISFEMVVMESIDEVFSTLGENVKQAMYSYLENNYGMKKDQIPSMIDDFTTAVESLFGDAAKLVELKIIEKVQGRVKGFVYKSNSKEIFFVEYLSALQKQLNLVE
jgi:hypothetical protein